MLEHADLVRKPRFLALTRRMAEIEGRRDMVRAQIARAKQVTAETRLRLNKVKTARMNEVVERLRAAQAERYDLEERLSAGRDVMKRTKIRAPNSGTVVDLELHTTGGVVRPGDRLMDIVPSKRRLIVQAHINPKDVDMVRGGLETKIRFTAFNQRSTPPVAGVITSVSADRLTDAETGEKYYLALIEIRDGAMDDALHAGGGHGHHRPPDSDGLLVGAHNQEPEPRLPRKLIRRTSAPRLT